MQSCYELFELLDDGEVSDDELSNDYNDEKVVVAKIARWAYEEDHEAVSLVPSELYWLRRWCNHCEGELSDDTDLQSRGSICLTCQAKGEPQKSLALAEEMAYFSDDFYYEPEY